MYVLIEVLFALFQGLMIWARPENEEPANSRYVKVSLVVLVLALVVILIYINNPAPPPANAYSNSVSLV